MTTGETTFGKYPTTISVNDTQLTIIPPIDPQII